MLRQRVFRKSFNLFKNFGVWDIPGMLKLGYPKIADYGISQNEPCWDIPTLLFKDRFAEGERF